MESNNRVGGGCFCGRVQFEIALPVRTVIFCHCNLCRRANGSDYSTWVSVPQDNFFLVQGENDLVRSQATVYASSYFCLQCSTTVYTEDIRYPAVYGLLRGIVRGDIKQEPSKHLFYDRKQTWIEFNDGLPKYGGESGFEPL